ncbi:metallophosphoesterase family protein [Paenibacillus flagellatus]|uniref:Calcineurin-like phosphoesterase domain-containing protein n=1 Tax=Paenibacillus flagellatus TaxID=2211139 RepID=A0A2V5KXR3_9BACL|nr:metallophosphoesterase [Paenibacillus flagellatus]PYI57287.1 hypothetical protein DLM86_02270 [Paenibacillus flagellatus]
MRIVILGDFHLRPEDYEQTRAAMEDVAACKPDLIVPLGDFGSQGKIGSIAGLEESEPFLRLPGVPLRPILGNHDLELESGNGKQPKGTMRERFLRMFQLDRPYGVLEYDDIRLFFASTEPQRPDSCYDVQEVFATDEQFAWLSAKLKERPGVPVIFFTHAPPVGSGLRTVPRVHVRSTNAYLDENHDPYRWYRLFRHSPEIVLWFSAHYHLSHIHPDSSTYRFGTRFFITGVHGAGFTRDGMRQSRIVDIGEQSVAVRTLDHIKRAVTDEGGWRHEGPLRSLIAKPGVSLSRVGSFPVGEAPAIRGGIVPLSPDRCLVSTEDGFTWEAEPEVEAVFGTCHIGPALTAVGASEERIWFAWGRSVGCSDRRSPWRFVRAANGDWPFVKRQLEEEADAMAVRPEGGAWVAAGPDLWKVVPEHGALSAARMVRLPERSVGLTADGSFVWSVADSGTVYRYEEGQPAFQPVMEGVRAWDSWRGFCAAITIGNGGTTLLSADGLTRYAVSLPAPLREDDGGSLQVVCLGNHHLLALVGGQVYFAIANRQIVSKLDTTDGYAAAVSRAYAVERDGTCRTFYLSVRHDDPVVRPTLQLWEASLHD